MLSIEDTADVAEQTRSRSPEGEHHTLIPGRLSMKRPSSTTALGGRPALPSVKCQQAAIASKSLIGEEVMSKKDDNKHREKAPDGDKTPPGPIKPDTIREPKPGKRGR